LPACNSSRNQFRNGHYVRALASSLIERGLAIGRFNRRYRAPPGQDPGALDRKPVSGVSIPRFHAPRNLNQLEANAPARSRELLAANGMPHLMFTLGHRLSRKARHTRMQSANPSSARAPIAVQPSGSGTTV
jgi:hypothetical protein